MDENVVPFNFLTEVQKSANINALFPEKETLKAILWLYAKIKDGAFPKSKFKEQDIISAFIETTPEGFQRIPQERFNSIIADLQEYYLRYDDDEQVYILKDFAINICRQVEDALIGNFNPTQIEIICAELKRELLNCKDENSLTHWLQLNFTAFEPKMNSQVDNLDRHIDAAVAEIRQSAQLQEGEVLETLKKIDGQLERIRHYNKELRAAFAAMKEINTELDIRLINTSSDNLQLLDLLKQTRQFFPGVRYRLDLIDKRLDRLQPRLRQFFGALNKPLFNTKVERFLRFILKNSIVKTEGVKKLIYFPDNIPSFRIFQETSYFIVVERKDDLFPALSRKVKTYEQTPEERRESYEALGKKVMQQDKIMQWIEKICHDCREYGKVDFSTYFFRIVKEEEGNIELAAKVAHRLLKIAPHENLDIQINNENTITKDNVSIWEMTIQYS